ncbi:cupin domain-containing protein [Amycolatopsis sp.]|uniref:cupin domain-containing protein n=1 Tax=Amycolatopsis sp. TaxID=37632 RepID=UPI002D800800|nr:cupin domain-containing protein [Amycolatopsis sp.]HET6711248.1 cupin domain-containing protein [Amycolatopsis sp.]
MIGKTAGTVLAAAGLALAVPPGTADATPGRGVSAVTLFDHVVGGTDYVLKEITLAPGGSTGWHYHPGQVTGYVKQGVLSHNESSCAGDGVYHAGQLISEESGPGYVHIGRNLGTTPVVLEVLYRSPVGQPLAVDAPNPGCPFE